jgi:FkbM family methyltransferase
MSSPLGSCKLCELGDFSDPEMRDLIREVYSSEWQRHGPGFPAGREYRKHWEIAMAIRALDAGGALREDARILGVGAGTEATIFWLTNRVERVVATDLYATDAFWVGGGSEPEMLTDPGRFWDGPWEESRLEVRHMNALDLEFEDNSFDGVFSSGSIEHFGGIAEVRRGVGEIHRVLKPGGVATISTEFRLAGPGPGLPGTLLFDEEELRAVLLDGLTWETLGPLELQPSPETMATEVSFEEAIADQHAGRDGFSTYPHIVLRHGEFVWTSVHVALVKPERPAGEAGESAPRIADVPDSAPPPQRFPDRLDPARRAVRAEAEVTWAGPSRLGGVGRFLRRALWRVLRPYDVRRREVEASLIDAVDDGYGAVRGEAARVPPPIAGMDVVEVDTPIGSFVLDRKDTLVRPAIEAARSWDYDVASLIERSLKPGMRFLDVGANLGYFTVLGSRLVGPNGSVVAVEPDPNNLQLLRANLWRNGCSNVRVLPLAADSRRGHISLVIFPEGGAATEVTRDAARYEADARVEVEDIGRIMAPTAPLDDLVVPPVDVIKMDTQFTEHEVIEGLLDTIAASPDLLIISEFGPEEIRRRKVDPKAVLERWAGLGFDIKVLEDGREKDMSFEEIVSAPNDMPLGNGPFFELVMRKGRV